MEVLKTTSPTTSARAPNPRPRHTLPSSSASIASISVQGTGRSFKGQEQRSVAGGRKIRRFLPRTGGERPQARDCLLPAYHLRAQERLRFVHPMFLRAIFVSGRSLSRLDAGAHLLGSFIHTLQAMKRQPVTIMPFGIRGPLFKESFKSKARIFILSSLKVGMPDLAPYLALTVISVTAHDRVEIIDGIGK